MSKRNADYIGRKYGRLTVIDRAEDYISPKGWHDSRWVCQCECGNKTIVRGLLLRNGHTTSCGCYASEQIAKFNTETKKKYNEYDLSGKYGIGYTNNTDSFGRNYFYFDLEDYDLIKDYCWYFSNSDGYVYTNAWDAKNKVNNRKKMHRVVMNLKDNKLDVDHIHGNLTRNDNRKTNLRIATRSQNIANRAILKNNTSGTTGVSWDRFKNKWAAYISWNNKQNFLGYYDKKEDATSVRKEAEKKYFKEFSYEYSQMI